MEQKQNKVLFPGQKKGLVRVLIKRKGHEETTQLHFHLFDNDPKVNY